MLCGYAIDSRARPGEQGPVSCGLKRCKDLGIQLPQISNSVETLPCSSGQLLMEIVAIAFPISHPITSRIYKNEVYNILMYILFMYIHILVFVPSPIIQSAVSDSSPSFQEKLTNPTKSCQQDYFSKKQNPMEINLPAYPTFLNIPFKSFTSY